MTVSCIIYHGRIAYGICHSLHSIALTRNGKIVWKHGPNRPIYALMLRTKLYQNPFFSTVHQNINKQKGQSIKTVCELRFHLPMSVLIRDFFSFVKMQTCQHQKNVATCKRNKLAIYQTQNVNGESNWQIKKLFLILLLGAS